jgi:hypothetical protein
MRFDVLAVTEAYVELAPLALDHGAGLAVVALR